MTTPCHPAPYSAPILQVFRELIPSRSLVLDPFAGIGRIHQLADPERFIETIGVEIEPEWAELHTATICGDATELPEDWSEMFDVVATSPCYGNRFADSHQARDGSTRRSYTHDLRAFTGDPERRLADNNAGKLHWGRAYQELHERAWAEVWRVLKPGGRFLLNVSDHVRGKQLQHVPEWHLVAITALGFDHCGTHFVETRRLKHGENTERADHEEVQVYRKPMPRPDPFRLLHGDCLDVLRTLPDCSVDSVVTDPPAGIAFMGKAWDGDKGGRDQWIAWLAERLTECLRVLKPGGHAVVWALPRTSGWTHRALEDAGFDVRDCVHHLFGSGFPKSLDVGKAIDKRGGADIGWFGPWLRTERRRRGISSNQLAQHFPSRTGGETGCVRNWELSLNLPTPDQFNTLCHVLDLPFDQIEEAERVVVGQRSATRLEVAPGEGRLRPGVRLDVTAPATAEAQKWDGWGTALKPAVEHWWLARKPLDSTVAGTVTRWGTGALNIAATRVGWDARSLANDTKRRQTNGTDLSGGRYGSGDAGSYEQTTVESPSGRWPADVVLSHSATCDDVCTPGCAVAELDQQSGTQPARWGKGPRGGTSPNPMSWGRSRSDIDQVGGPDDYGGASRFFPTFRYQAKPSTREKNRWEGAPLMRWHGEGPPLMRWHPIRNTHPTVKPVELMRWLVRLVTPPGGTVLDPFAGSGSTFVAAALEGFDCIGVEAEAEYLPLIDGRLRAALVEAKREPLARASLQLSIDDGT